MARVSITFEQFREELISIRGFLIRLLKFYLIATALLFSCLLPGALGLHFIEGMTFTDAFVDALSILGTIDPPFV